MTCDDFDVMCSLSFEEILNRIDVWDDWRANYKRMVPLFIKEALMKTDWKDWDQIGRAHV